MRKGLRRIATPEQISSVAMRRELISQQSRR